MSYTAQRETTPAISTVLVVSGATFHAGDTTTVDPAHATILRCCPRPVPFAITASYSPAARPVFEKNVFTGNVTAVNDADTGVPE